MKAFPNRNLITTNLQLLLLMFFMRFECVVIAFQTIPHENIEFMNKATEVSLSSSV